MLILTEIELVFSKQIKVRQAMGSVMHGALMDCISQDAAICFHTMLLRPYSQCVYWNPKEQKAVWRIGTLNEYAFEQIIRPLQQRQSLHLNHQNCDIQFKACHVIRQTDYDKLARSFVQDDTSPVGSEWHFCTTASFKQAGQYVIMPDSHLIYQSLLNRWNAFSPTIKLEEENLAAHCRLLQYQLRSQVFPVEGQSVYGFSGTQRYGFYGYDMLKRLQGLLTVFAEFAGVGVKTALGMGAVETKVLYKKE